MQVKEIQSKKFFKEYSVEIPSKKIEEETKKERERKIAKANKLKAEIEELFG